MAQARGADTKAILYEESVYGVDPGVPAGKVIYLTANTLSSDQPLQNSNTLTASRGRAKPVPGNLNATGDLNVELNPETLGWLLKHAFGAITTTGAAVPYTHDFAIDVLPPGLQIEKDYSSAITTGRYEKFNGVKVSSMALNFPSEGFCTGTFSMLGAGSILADTPLDASPTDDLFTPFDSFSASVEEGGVSIAYVNSCSMTLDNGLDPNIYAIGGLGNRRALPEGQATISGQAVLLFENTDILNKAINGTESSLRVILTRGLGDGTSGNEYLEFLVQQLLWQRTSAPIDGPGGLQITMPFTGFKSGVDLGMTAQLRNQIAAY